MSAQVRCPQCQKTFGVSIPCCPFDGSWLEPIGQERKPQEPEPFPSLKSMTPAPRAPPPRPGAAPHMDTKAPTIAPVVAKRLETVEGHAVGTVIANRYEVQSELGSGGFGLTLKCQDQKFRRTVALKLMHARLREDKDARRRFELEALALSRIDHPNVVQVYDMGETPEGEPYFAMEFVEGKLVSELLRAAPLPQAEVCELGAQLLEALEAAHAKGFIHRDLKPSNLVISHDERKMPLLKVLDFGVAAVTAGGVETALRDFKSQMAGSVVGTPAYMSPEQALGGSITAASDIYSSAVVLYQLLTGNLPSELPQAWTAVSIDRYVKAPHVPIFKLRKDADKELVRTLDRALEKDVEKRFRRAAEVAADLRRIKARLLSRPGRALAIRRLVTVAVLVAGAWGVVDVWPTVEAWAFPAISDFVAHPPTAADLQKHFGMGDDTAPANAEKSAPATPASSTPSATKTRTHTAKKSSAKSPEKIAETKSALVGGDAGFRLDRFEVTVDDYTACVDANVCSPPRDGDGCLALADDDLRPVNCVNWAQSAAYCAWRHARLPTDAEWDRAARGEEKRAFPWGPDEPECSRALLHECGDGPSAVGLRQGGATPQGVQDLVGNVAEWVDAANVGVDFHVARGGSYETSSAELGTAMKVEYISTMSAPGIGFRCAR